MARENQLLVDFDISPRVFVEAANIARREDRVKRPATTASVRPHT